MSTTTPHVSSRRNGTGAAPARPPISTHLQLVSPKQAREILQAEAYVGQRPLRPYQVRYLQGLIERGHLRAGTSIAFAVLAGQRHLINGQHTLTALGQTSGAPIWLQLEEIRVATLEEVGVLYESYDRNLARSWADLYHADAALQQYELAPKHLSALGAACTPLAIGFQVVDRQFHAHSWAVVLKDAQIRFALMAAWQDEMRNFSASCQGPGSVRRLLTRGSVLSVALVTYRFQPEAAQQFWPSLARDSGLTEGEPAHSLLRWLRDTPTRRLETAAYQRVVAAAWNAAFQGRQLFKLSGRQPAQPILIAGTPHDGTVCKRYLTDAGQVLQSPVEEEARIAVVEEG